MMRYLKFSKVSRDLLLYSAVDNISNLISCAQLWQLCVHFHYLLHSLEVMGRGERGRDGGEG